MDGPTVFDLDPASWHKTADVIAEEGRGWSDLRWKCEQESIVLAAGQDDCLWRDRQLLAEVDEVSSSKK